jgi:hypothetical protein
LTPGEALDELRELALDRWRIVLAALGAVFGLVPVIALFSARFPFPMKGDTALYQHGGWALHQGHAMYRQLWEVKPPLSYEAPALLSMLAGGNVVGLHVLSVAATVAAALGICLLIGKLVHERTGNPMAALLAGLVPLTYAWFVLRPAYGFSPKYFSFLFGLASVHLLDRERPGWAGASAVASTGFWQFGVVFALIALARVVRDPRARWRAAAGGAVVGGAALLPIVVTGAFVPMIVETTVVGLLVGDDTGLLVRGGRSILFLRYAFPLVLAGGVAGLASGGRQRSWRWVSLLSLWVGLQLLFLDFDGPADLLFPAVAAGLGFGYLVDAAPDRKRLLAGLVAGSLLVVALGVGGWGVVFDPVTDSRAESRADPALVHRGLQVLAGEPEETDPTSGLRPDIQQAMVHFGGRNMPSLYWNEVLPETCHFRLGTNEVTWLQETGRPFRDTDCGRWPSELI